jgi:hypothetical protein
MLHTSELKYLKSLLDTYEGKPEQEFMVYLKLKTYAKAGKTDLYHRFIQFMHNEGTVVFPEDKYKEIEPYKTNP